MILVDTGPLVAVADADDANHRSCVRFFDTAPRPLLVATPVIVEVCYLLARNLGSVAEATFLRAFPRELTLQEVTASDLRRSADLVEQYRDLSLGMVDATLIAISERLRLRAVATLDRRHFSVVRPRHVAALDLVP
ncbi:MAG: PIN domain-containing protein [Candidatus Dormibacteraeota bacterium]|nr:PIN domain-containing protein [Candidatus Dormibacteraeota bacterium]